MFGDIELGDIEFGYVMFGDIIVEHSLDVFTRVYICDCTKVQCSRCE